MSRSLKQIAPAKLPDVLEQLKNDVMATLNCVQIGIIEAFYPENQTCDIKLALKKVVDIKPDGTRLLEEHPILLTCPVMVLYGGAGHITMPIAKGDSCIVLFNDREIDNWFSSGGVQTPTTFRKHDFSDGFAIVGIRSLQSSISDYLTAGIRLSFPGAQIDLIQDQIATVADLFVHTGNMQVNGVLTASEVHAGNGATGSGDFVTVVDGIVIAVS